MAVDLDTLFPPAPAHERATNMRGRGTPIDRGEGAGVGRKVTKHIPTRHRTICSLELRGHDKKQIAEALGLAYQTVINITNSDRYAEVRDALLADMDNDFIAMKPLALSALKGGLTSRDEQTALRASDQWFKAAGYGGYSRDPPVDKSITAEDVARQLMLGVTVNVNVEK